MAIDAHLPATIREAIAAAMLGQRPVVLALRDTATAQPTRTVEGVPVEIATARDGRERIVLRVAEETEQFVLLERVAHVLAA